MAKRVLCRFWYLSAYCASKASCHLKLALLTLSHVSVLVICMGKCLFLTLRKNRLGGNSSTHCRKPFFPELTQGLGQSKPSNTFDALAAFGLMHWLLFLLPPQETKLFCSHLKPFTGRLRMDSGKARVETLCSFAQVCKSQWSWKECTSCPCIQSPPLASSHVLWTPRKAWHSRDVPQGWHPHATSSSDCSPAAVLQTFPALPAPQQQLQIPNVQGIGHCVGEAELYTCMWCLHILGLWLGLLKKDFIFNLY